jgi:hypothetical protein
MQWAMSGGQCVTGDKDKQAEFETLTEQMSD